MCKRVCNKLAENEQMPVTSEIIQVETISEERASRCIQRVELLNKVRQDVLKHDKFDEWIGARCLPSADLPDWYVPGKHDCELVKAAARYGINRTEFYFVNDAEFSFKEYLERYMSHIEELMRVDNEAAGDDVAMHNVDPIQYYFQNQAKIQSSFKQWLSAYAGGGTQAKKEEPTDEPLKEEVKEEVSVSAKEEVKEEGKVEEADANKTITGKEGEDENENDTSKNQLMIDEESLVATPKKSPKKSPKNSPKTEEQSAAKTDEKEEVEKEKDEGDAEKKGDREEAKEKG